MNLEQKTITSMEVADMVGKNHADLLRDIKRYVSQLGESKIAFTDFFTESTYQTSQNKTAPCYLVTKKGCEFIAHKLTGVKGTEFTAKYIDKFHDMEDEIKSGIPTRKLSPEQMMRIQLGMLDEQNERLDCVENKVDHLENTMNIDYAQQKQLKNFANEVIVNALGGKSSPAYKHKADDGSKMSSQCFSRFWHDFNDYFNINAYANLPRVRFKDALEYINKYNLPTNTQLEIGKINRGA